MDIARPITFQITPPRRFRRQNLRYEGSKVELNCFRLEGRVLNLSLTGLAIETPNRILVGGEYTLHLASGDVSTDVVARVQWCRMKGTRGAANGDVHPVFHAGLALAGENSDAYEALFKQLQKSGSAVAAEPPSATDEEPVEAAASTNAA